MNVKETLRNTEKYLAERLPVEKMNYASMVQKKEVPVHGLAWGYYMGGLAMFFLMVQIATGLMLLFYYQPTVSDAHASVEYITEQVPAGALVRNVHAWASSLMIGTLPIISDDAQACTLRTSAPAGTCSVMYSTEACASLTVG